MLEDLPRSIAFALARARPLEPERDRHAPLLAWVELAVLRLLSDALRDLTSLPFPVESAMRASMTEPMTHEAWLEILGALRNSGHLDALGLPEPLPEPVLQAADGLGAEPGVLGLARAALEEPAPADLEPAVVALVRSSRLGSEPLCWVIDAAEADGGCAARLRVLSGTGWPQVVRRQLAVVPADLPGLFFLTPDGEPVPVPRWLAGWDDTEGVLWLYAGRDRSSGRWLRTTRCPAARRAEADAPEGELPVFLAEPTWGTPAPVNRQFMEPSRTDSDTTRFAVGRVAVPPKPGVGDPGGRTAVRVVNGRDLHRYAVLEAGTELVVGRNPAATLTAGSPSRPFTVHHHQVSRVHARIRLTDDGRVLVRDARSANGTLVGGRRIPGDTDTVAPRGEVIAVGPVLMRIEGLSSEREARLAAIARLREDEGRRDPLTSLLVPKHLVDELPDALRPGFATGDPPGPAEPSLWGVLVYVDRLSAIHAQHGEQIANEIFHNVARLVQVAVDTPERCVRVGYGELLVPLVGVDHTGACVAAEQLLEVVRDHPWPAPVVSVGLTAAVARKHPDEGAQDWLQRGRTALQDGRLHQGRGRVYAAAGD